MPDPEISAGWSWNPDVHITGDYQLSEHVDPVCKAEVLSKVWVYLPKWPNPWVRFWHWAFFGVKWVAIDETP